MRESEKKVCIECQGAGVVYRKVWTQPKAPDGVHPAIAAGAPAFRSIATFRCPLGCKISEKK